MEENWEIVPYLYLPTIENTDVNWFRKSVLMSQLIDPYEIRMLLKCKLLALHIENFSTIFDASVLDTIAITPLYGCYTIISDVVFGGVLVGMDRGSVTDLQLWKIAGEYREYLWEDVGVGDCYNYYVRFNQQKEVLQFSGPHEYDKGSPSVEFSTTTEQLSNAIAGAEQILSDFRGRLINVIREHVALDEAELLVQKLMVGNE